MIDFRLRIKLKLRFHKPNKSSGQAHSGELQAATKLFPPFHSNCFLFSQIKQ